MYLSFSPLPFASLLFSAICKASSDSYFTFLCLLLGDGFNQHLLYNVMKGAQSQLVFFFKHHAKVDRWYVILEDRTTATSPPLPPSLPLYS